MLAGNCVKGSLVVGWTAMCATKNTRLRTLANVDVCGGGLVVSNENQIRCGSKGGSFKRPCVN